MGSGSRSLVHLLSAAGTWWWMRAARDALAEAVAGLDRVTAIAGDVADPDHRRALVEAAGDRDRPRREQREPARARARCRALADYPLDALREVYEANVFAPLALRPARAPAPGRGRGRARHHLGRRRRGLRGLGRLRLVEGGARAAQAILAAEQPALRVYWVDPGDMRTQMHQDAFPGEDISDRPPPEESVPGLLALIEGDLPSGRYRASEVGGGAVIAR